MTGRAFPDRAEFWWRYDPYTYDSWARILRKQANQGRDVFGISPRDLALVTARSWRAFARFAAGKPHAPALPPPVVQPAVAPAPKRLPMVGTTRMRWATTGIGATPELLPGQTTGGATWETWLKHLRGPAPTPKGIDRRRPFNVLLRMIFGPTRPAGAAPAAPAPPGPPPVKPKPIPKPPPKPAPPPPPSPPVKRPPKPKPTPREAAIRDLIDYGKRQGYEIHRIDNRGLIDRFGFAAEKTESIPMLYYGSERRIYLNTEARVFGAEDLVAHAARQERQRWWAVGHPFGMVDHEIGHARHHDAIGTAFDDATLNRVFGPEVLLEVTGKVSSYAGYSPKEFVAEVYAALKHGKSYDDSIMDLYKTFGGVLP